MTIRYQCLSLLLSGYVAAVDVQPFYGTTDAWKGDTYVIKGGLGIGAAPSPSAYAIAKAFCAAKGNGDNGLPLVPGIYGKELSTTDYIFRCLRDASKEPAKTA
jgi:hypothetical protein